MIKLNNLSAGYSKKHPVLQKLQTTFAQGNIYGLLGANGSGKTTLLKTICGVLFPLDGEISAMGYTPQKRESDFLKEIFYIPDEFSLPTLTVEKYVDTYAQFRPNFSLQKFESALKAMNFTFGEHLHRLSLGNRKKFLISFALACNSPVVIMDEPTNGLDIEAKRSFRSLLAAEDLTDRLILISSHAVTDLEHILSAVAIIHNGAVVINSTIDAIAANIAFTSSANCNDALYTDGLRAIVKAEAEWSDVDLEMLYMAIHKSKDFRQYVIENFSGKESVCNR